MTDFCESECEICHSLRELYGGVQTYEGCLVADISVQHRTCS
jgi:hypothetical protein